MKSDSLQNSISSTPFRLFNTKKQVCFSYTYGYEKFTKWIGDIID